MSNNFNVILQSQPEKYYRKASKNIAKLLNNCFEQLENDPFYFPGKIKRLQNAGGLFRYRVKDLRVVYEIDQKEKIVNIVAILPRGDIYKKVT